MQHPIPSHGSVSMGGWEQERRDGESRWPWEWGWGIQIVLGEGMRDPNCLGSRGEGSRLP